MDTKHNTNASNNWEKENYSDEEEDEQQAGYEEITLPDYVPDDLVPPDFKDEEEELAFYRSNYSKAVSLVTSPEFGDVVLKEYEDKLIEKEQDHERFKALKVAFDSNPEAAIKFYFPEALEQRGYRTTISGDEAEQWVSSKMADEFGEDYLERYDSEEAGLKPKSESAKMWAVYDKTKAELAQHNERAKQVEDQSRPLSTEAKTELLQKQYEETFKSFMSKDEYEVFLGEASEKSLTLLDVFRAFNFDHYITAAEDDGYKRGKRDAINGVRKSVRTTVVQAERPMKPKEDVRYNNPVEMFNALKYRK